MKEMMLINPVCKEAGSAMRLEIILKKVFSGKNYSSVFTAEEFCRADLRNKNIVFAVALDESAVNMEYYRILREIRTRVNCFSGSSGVVIVDGSSELYTKSVAKELILAANMRGCAFPGKSLVEGTLSLSNFNTTAHKLSLDNLSAYIHSGTALINRLENFNPKAVDSPEILVVYTGNKSISNSFELWQLIKKHLISKGIAPEKINEISLRNGKILDCRGCSYADCVHFGEAERCFYGGLITEKIYPALLKCDGLVIVCPNYNDAAPANIMAFINRLTALFRTHSFREKRMFGVIVSGYSGGNIVAEQLLGALNINKNFMLPAGFAIMETANDPGSIHKLENIDKRAEEFAYNIITEFSDINAKNE